MYDSEHSALMLDRSDSYEYDHMPKLSAVLSLYEMSDSDLLARRSALLGELVNSLTPEERTWLLDVVNVVYLAGHRDGMRVDPQRPYRPLPLP